MNVTIRSETREYHVSFEQDNSKVLIKGPNKGRPQTVTTCEIFLMTGASGPTLISTGVTTLGSRDKPDSLIGCKEAFTRALSTTYFSKAETTVFWKEFRKRHKRIDTVKPSCTEKFSNVAGKPFSVNHCPHRRRKHGNWCKRFNNTCVHETPCDDIAKRDTIAQEAKKYATGGMVHGYGGLHSFQKEAIKKLRAIGPPLEDHLGEMYLPRHEYSDIPFQSHMGRVTRDYSKGGLVDVRKLHGLGWQRPVPKMSDAEQLRKAYNYHLPSTFGARIQAENRNHRVGKTIINPTEADYAESERRIAAAIPQPAEDRVTIVNTTSHADAMKAINKNHKKIRDIITEADRYKRLRDLCAVADDGLTAHMRSMQLLAGEKADKLDTELLSRPGITKVFGEYIIDADVFVSPFKVGDIVTSDKFGIGKVTKVEGVFLTVQPGMRVGRQLHDYGQPLLVPDWNCKKRVGRLRRWLRTMTKIHREDGLTEDEIGQETR